MTEPELNYRRFLNKVKGIGFNTWVFDYTEAKLRALECLGLSPPNSYQSYEEVYADLRDGLVDDSIRNRIHREFKKQISIAREAIRRQKSKLEVNAEQADVPKQQAGEVEIRRVRYNQVRLF